MSSQESGSAGNPAARFKRPRLDDEIDDERLDSELTSLIDRRRPRVGVAHSRGSRVHYEDAHVVPDAPTEWFGESPPSDATLTYAIFDGHGGRDVADYAAQHLVPKLNEIKAKTGLKAQIRQAYVDFDAKCLAEARKRGWLDGCTAVTASLVGDMCCVANCGDARAVLCRTAVASPPDGGVDGVGVSDAQAQVSLAHKALVLTKEHQPILIAERERITAAGGRVLDGRVDGRLAVSRSLGDVAFKSMGVTASPDVCCFKVSERERFLVLGCDGLWGGMEPADVTKFVADRLSVSKRRKYVLDHVAVSALSVGDSETAKRKRTMSRSIDGHVAEIAHDLVRECQDRGSQDNVTVVLVVFG